MQSWRGLDLQISSPSSHSGVSLPCPVILASPCHVSSVAETLPDLLLDPYLHPLLSNTDAWHNSPILTLSDAAASFRSITSTPHFNATSDQASTRTAATLLMAPDGSYDLAKLPNLARRKPQRAFVSAIFHALYEEALRRTSPLDDSARIGLTFCAQRGATAIFVSYTLPPSLRLTDREHATLYLHRLRIPLPFLPMPPRNFCPYPRCASFPEHKEGRIPPEVAAVNGHDFVCGPKTDDRHELILHLIGDAARTESACTVDYERHSNASADSKLTDCLLQWLDGSQTALKLDPTISCPFVTTHRRFAARNGPLAFHTRLAAAKNGKHLDGCNFQQCRFLPITFSTLGDIGPPESITFLDSLFHLAQAREHKEGYDGTYTARRRIVFYQSLQAAMARGNHAIIAFTHSGRHPPHVPPTAAPP